MIKRIGFIGVGHLSAYLIRGLRTAAPDLKLYYADPHPARAEKLARQYGGEVVPDNQVVVDRAEVIILAVRPMDVVTAIQDLIFRSGQTLISVAAGVPIEKIRPHAHPAEVVRSLPISCSAINLSPTLIYPENKRAGWLFDLLGRTHLLPNEEMFATITALGGYYAWIFALMDETIEWAAASGMPEDSARDIVAETVRGAAGMALDQKDLSLRDIWTTLATPGGISEQGLKILHRRKSLDAWREALEAVAKRMRGD